MPVNNGEFLNLDSRIYIIVNKHYAAEEVRKDLVVLSTSENIVEQLFAMLMLPIVIPLIDRDNEPSLGLSEKVNQLYIVGIHRCFSKIDLYLSRIALKFALQLLDSTY